MENTDLGIEIILTLVSVLLLILVITLPLLPAILIYKIFPDTHIKAEGSIGALTWKSSGAFAAYIIVLSCIILSPLNRLTDAIGGFYNPTWTIEFEVHGYDRDARPKRFDDINVVLDPAIHRISPDRISLRIPGIKRSEWPIAHIQVPGGARDINLAALRDDEIRIDNYRKHVEILAPMEIREVATATNPYPAPGDGYLQRTAGGVQ